MAFKSPFQQKPFCDPKINKNVSTLDILEFCSTPDIRLVFLASTRETNSELFFLTIKLCNGKEFLNCFVKITTCQAEFLVLDLFYRTSV